MEGINVIATKMCGENNLLFFALSRGVVKGMCHNILFLETQMLLPHRTDARIPRTLQGPLYKTVRNPLAEASLGNIKIHVSPSLSSYTSTLTAYRLPINCILIAYVIQPVDWQRFASLPTMWPDTLLAGRLP